MLLALPEAFIFTALVYWMFGLVSGVAGYVGFVLVLFLTSTAFCGWTFLLSTVCATAEMVESIATLLTLIFTLFAGLFVTRVNIPVYLVWTYWINPIAWGLRAISVQQYTDKQFDTCVYDGIDYCALYGKPMGTYSLESFDIYPESYWFWAGLGFLAATSVACYTVGGLALESVRHQTSVDTHDTIEQQAANNGDNSTDSDDTDPGSDSTTSKNTVHIAVLTPRASHRVTPVTLAFENLRYSVPDPANEGEMLELLKGISGFAKPKTITALMGSTGAGKTTLMDVIAGRKTGGNIQGRVLSQRPRGIGPVDSPSRWVLRANERQPLRSRYRPRSSHVQRILASERGCVRR